MAEGIIPDAASWALIQRVVRQVLAEGKGDGSDGLGQPIAATRILFCLLNGSLAAGGSQTAKALRLSGGSWVTTTETLTVRDYRTSGNAIASGKRCVALWCFGAWWVVSVGC